MELGIIPGYNLICTCEFKGICELNVSDIEAKIKAYPAQVSSLTATDIGGASATLKWTASAGASEYIIYKKDVGTNCMALA